VERFDSQKEEARPSVLTRSARTAQKAGVSMIQETRANWDGALGGRRRAPSWSGETRELLAHFGDPFHAGHDDDEFAGKHFARIVVIGSGGNAAILAILVQQTTAQ